MMFSNHNEMKLEIQTRKLSRDTRMKSKVILESVFKWMAKKKKATYQPWCDTGKADHRGKVWELSVVLLKPRT